MLFDCSQRHAFFAAVLFAFFLSGAPSAWAWGVSSKYREGDILMSQRKYEEAADYWAKFLKDKKNAKDTQALLRYGTALSMCEKYEEAEKVFREALALKPKDPILLQNMGLLYMRQRRLDEAERYFKKSLAVRNWQPNCNYYLGVISEMRGDTDAAVRHYVDEVNVNPRNQACWRRLLFLREKGDKGKPDPISLKTAIALCALCIIISVILMKKKYEREQQNRWRKLNAEAQSSSSSDSKVRVS